MAWCAALALGVATSSLAVPPVPTQTGPVDGGWAASPADLDAQLLPRIPAGVPAFEFETHSPQGVVTWSKVQKLGVSATTITATTSRLPDAGLHYWRVRGVDDAGVTSAWSPFEAFEVDDQPPPFPATLTVSMDGGLATLTCSPVVDSQSGVKLYHFFISELDPPDASVLNASDLRFRVPAPTIQLRLGPGRWLLGAHAHDAVDNTPSTGTTVGPVEIVPSAAAPTPSAPTPVRSDGGTYAQFPYLPTNDPRWAWTGDAGVAYVFIARPVGGVAWTQIGDGVAQRLQTTNVGQGELDVRLAVLQPTAVSDWSAPTRVWVDNVAPNVPTPVAAVDGGAVTLSWGKVTDQNASTTGSGVREYEVSRCCRADAGAVVATVPDGPVSSLNVTEAPGPGVWTWSVVTVDRALNRSVPGEVVQQVLPPTPTLHIAAPVTQGPVDLSWNDVADGGFVAVYDVARLDGDGGFLDAGAGLAATALMAPAPEGSWAWVVRAVSEGLTGDWSPAVVALVDTTPPTVSAVLARRQSEREVRVEWTASDSASGVASAQLERDTAGAVTALGVAASGFVDTPPDGVHRYRVTVIDGAGNATPSAWSTALETPGSGVVISPPPPTHVTCGGQAVVPLEATGEPVTRWSLVEPVRAGASIDEASGVLRYSPRPTDVGTVSLLVRAEATTSLAERAIEVEVTCAAGRYGVHCGCDAGSGGLVALGFALLLRRRRARR